jgi:hypothetical protein
MPSVAPVIGIVFNGATLRVPEKFLRFIPGCGEHADRCRARHPKHAIQDAHIPFSMSSLCRLAM